MGEVGEPLLFCTKETTDASYGPAIKGVGEKNSKSHGHVHAFPIFLKMVF